MDSNDKILLSCSNLSLGFAQNVPNLRGIRDDFAVLCLQNLLIVAPTRNSKPSIWTVFFCMGRADSNGKLKFTRVRIFPSVLRRMRQTCGAFVTILRCVACKIYSFSPRPEIQNRPFGRFFLYGTCAVP